MPSLVVRHLDESIINALKARAATHHRSTEAEHRVILAEFLLNPQRKTFAEALACMPSVGTNSDFQRMHDDTPVTDLFD
jgi:plasmid stability protein